MNTLQNKTFPKISPLSITGYNSTRQKFADKKSSVSLKKYALFVDYLNLNLSGVPKFNDKRLKVDFAERGTRHYNKRCTISFSGYEVGVLLYDPCNPEILKDSSQFKISNYLFYTIPTPKLYKFIKLVLSALNLQYTSISRMDVALDLQNNQHNLQNVAKRMFSSELLTSGREKNIQYHAITKKGVSSLTGFSVGKRTSPRFLRVYDKTLENLEGNKEYITTAHKELGFNGQIWRYEYQLNNKFFRDLNTDLKTILSNKGLLDLYNTANNNYFQLKINTGKSQINKEKDYNFLCEKSLKYCISNKTNLIDRLKRNIKETLIGQKRMVKGLLRSYFSSRQRIEYILPLKIILNDFSLFDWWDKKLPFYLDEFKKKQIIKEFDRNQFNNDFALEV